MSLCGVVIQVVYWSPIQSNTNWRGGDFVYADMPILIFWFIRGKTESPQYQSSGVFKRDDAKQCSFGLKRLKSSSAYCDLAYSVYALGTTLCCHPAEPSV